MSLLIETIKCKDGKIINAGYHNFRLNKSRKKLFGSTNSIDLNKTIVIPEQSSKGIFKCRVLYSSHIERIEFIKHQYRKINSLKRIESNAINYSYKFENRELLEKLFEERGDCDDILIVKNGCITDSFSANVVFFDGKKWWTSDTPLLPGTQRAFLLDQGKIFERRIESNDLLRFEKAGLINAMQDLTEMPVIPIGRIN